MGSISQKVGSVMLFVCVSARHGARGARPHSHRVRHRSDGRRLLSPGPRVRQPVHLQLDPPHQRIRALHTLR